MRRLLGWAGRGRRYIYILLPVLFIGLLRCSRLVYIYIHRRLGLLLCFRLPRVIWLHADSQLSRYFLADERHDQLGRVSRCEMILRSEDGGGRIWMIWWLWNEKVYRGRERERERNAIGYYIDGAMVYIQASVLLQAVSEHY